jgi:hypothetical protein
MGRRHWMQKHRATGRELLKPVHLVKAVTETF